MNLYVAALCIHQLFCHGTLIYDLDFYLIKISPFPQHLEYCLAPKRHATNAC
jgi:hypothetical protein